MFYLALVVLIVDIILIVLSGRVEGDEIDPTYGVVEEKVTGYGAGGYTNYQ